MNIKEKVMLHSANVIRTFAIIISAYTYIIPLINKGLSLNLVTELISVPLMYEVVHLLITEISDNIFDFEVSKTLREFVGSVLSSIVCCTIVCTVFIKNLWGGYYEKSGWISFGDFVFSKYHGTYVFK